jgi:hypothetical protein
MAVGNTQLGVDPFVCNIDTPENLNGVQVLIEFIPENPGIFYWKIMIKRNGGPVFFFFEQTLFKLRLGDTVMQYSHNRNF